MNDSHHISFEPLFRNRKPITIHLDKGMESVNATVGQYLQTSGSKFNTHKERRYRAF